jgi:GNAT superfamily N-acetyltransferase
VEYWVQFIDNEPVSVIARLESTFILRLTNKSDIEEISSFIRVSGAETILCDGAYSLDLNCKSNQGYILVKREKFPLEDNFTIIKPTVKELYSIISQCNSDNFNVPEYENFALDVSHKLLKESIRIFGIKAQDELVSCIMTLAESDDSAVFGALATLPTARNCGYGTYLVKYLTNILLDENKAVYLHRAENENIEFYNNLGFEVYGTWKEYF